MGKIYSACSRVVVYLGPDIAMPLIDRHPRRRRLHEFETGEINRAFQIAVAARSSHRIIYLIFSGSELIMSQRVVIRIEDVDFWADSTMATHFSLKAPRWDWGTTAATWMQFTSQGTSKEMNLGELLEMSSASQATDPRDRIFGLLGVLHELKTESPSQRPKISDSLLSIKGGTQADYSLSCQQTFVGLFAYCLLNKNKPNILYRASCLSRKKPEYLLANKEGDLLSRYRVALKIYELRYIAKERHWRKGAFINASTASLNINLTQYMTLSHTLERVGTINELHLLCMRHDFLSVYIVSKERLDRVLTGKGNEELFVLNIDDCSFIYLLLRRQTDEHGAVTYKLISACPQVQILERTKRSGNEVQQLRRLRLDPLQFSVYGVLEKCREFLDNPFMAFLREPRDRGILVGITAIRDLVPVLKQLYQHRSQRDMSIRWPENVINAETPRDLYTVGEMSIQCVNQKFSPQFNGVYVTISVSTLWEEICRIYLFRSNISDNQHEIWKYRIKDSRSSWRSSWKSPYIAPSVYDNLLKLGSV
ncbi:unnamed protein product [Clonostachys rhizophaga]|uniref:Uncharacterized protein n=1 Tax=Clonostachys rhizophaga TaxID=160324 RepID=A0A9N9Y937_9HYPO|nr:unnamed protein product [Clonostachys rhizophaga]